MRLEPIEKRLRRAIRWWMRGGSASESRGGAGTAYKEIHSWRHGALPDWSGLDLIELSGEPIKVEHCSWKLSLNLWGSIEGMSQVLRTDV